MIFSNIFIINYYRLATESEARRLHLPIIPNAFANTGYDPQESPCQNW